MDMQDPRVGMVLKPIPAPQQTPPTEPAPFSRKPYIGQVVHFFPAEHIVADVQRHYGPMAAMIIELHVNDPRIASLYIFAQNGQVTSYVHIPHRSLTPAVYPVESWLGHRLPQQSHWEFTDA